MPYDIKRLETALVNADKAGDVQAAKTLANEIRKIRSTIQEKPIDNTGSFLQNAGAGLGKFFVDTGRSLNQMSAGMGLGGAGLTSQGATPEAKKYYDQEKERSKKLQEEIDLSDKEDKQLMDTWGGTLGNATPAVAASFLPGANTIKGMSLLGGALGALKPVKSDESRLGNIAENAAWFGGTDASFKGLGKLGRPLLAKATTELSPFKQRLVQSVEKMGGKVTPGQKSGKAWMQKLESALERDPLTGKWLDKSKKLNQQILSKKATAEIGEESASVSDDLLGKAYNRIGEMFESVHGENIKLGKDFSNAVNQAGMNFKKTWTGKGDSTARSLLEGATNAMKKGNLSGEEYNLIRSDLSGVLRSQQATHNTKQLAHDLINALDDAAEKGISGNKSGIVSQARNQYKKLIAIEKSLNGENVSAAKLSGHLTKADKKGYAQGGNKSDLYEMLRFQRNFPEAVPNSGTPTGMSMNNLLAQTLAGAGIGGGYGLYTGDPQAALYGAALPLASKKGMEYLYRGLGKYYTMNPLINASPEVLALIKSLEGATAAGTAQNFSNK